MPIQTIFRNDKCEWIDIEAPTEEDLKFLQERYEINWLLLEDTIDKDHLPKFENVDSVKFFLTRENTDLERQNLTGVSDVSTKLGIFLLEKLIITVHRMRTKTITETEKEVINDPKKDHLKPDSIALLLALKVMKSYDDECNNLMELLDKVENEIFLKNTSDSNQIRRLYRLKRKSGLNTRLLNLSTDWIAKYNELDLQDVEVADLKDKHRDVLADFDHLNAQVTNLISMFLALSDQKANQVMKLLTQFSVYFLPITFIAGVYGMNFKNMPELEKHYGYYYTIGFMLLVVIVIYIYMRRKKW